MRPAAVAYERPATVYAAIAALRDGGPDARVLAGGQTLVNQLRARTVRASTLVDVSRIEALRYVRAEDSELEVGALTRMRDLLDDGAGGWTALAEAAGRVADPQVRNRATAGGNLLNPDPVSDLAPVLLASGGRVLLEGPDGRRALDAEAFLRAPAAALGPAELIVALRFGRGDAAAGSAFEKLSRRAADAAIASAAAFVRVDDGVVAEVGLALGAVHAHPLRLHAFEQALAGAPFDERLAQAALAEACRELAPPSTPHAGAEHRREMAVVVALRALRRSAGATTRR
jgi:carbon-monoxide dehydrogenase medium subunit